jgi:membrane associated rhomboid family serine protease
MSGASNGRVSPAVGRVLFASIAAFIALRTVFTAPAVAAALRFDPARLADRPWTAFTYPLVHESVLHLLVTGLLVLAAGPRLERTLGARGFLVFYAYVAAGAALVGVALAQLVPFDPMSGGLAPALGLVFAYAWIAGDREVPLDPLPVRARIFTLATAVIGGALVLGAVRNEAGLSLAHLGGLPAAWLFFQLWKRAGPAEAVMPLPIRRPALAPMQLQRAEQVAAPETPHGPVPVSMGVEDAAEAVNRLLDKISARGLESLTPEERRILKEYAERKQERS